MNSYKENKAFAFDWLRLDDEPIIDTSLEVNFNKNSVIGTCSTLFMGNMFIIGGTEIARLNKCELESYGQLPTEFDKVRLN